MLIAPVICFTFTARTNPKEGPADVVVDLHIGVDRFPHLTTSRTTIGRRCCSELLTTVVVHDTTNRSGATGSGSGDMLGTSCGPLWQSAFELSDDCSPSATATVKKGLLQHMLAATRRTGIGGRIGMFGSLPSGPSMQMQRTKAATWL